jgi:hypothetical protein
MAGVTILVYAPSASPLLEGKFLQLLWDGREYLVFASASLHRYHNQILAQFCADHGIAHGWVAPERLEVADSRLEVRGGGRFRAEAGRGTLLLYDASQAYGRFDERGLAEKIAAADHPWRRYTITIS